MYFYIVVPVTAVMWSPKHDAALKLVLAVDSQLLDYPRLYPAMMIVSSIESLLNSARTLWCLPKDISFILH